MPSNCWLWFWFDNGHNACGAVATDANGIVRHACPIYWRYRGRRFNEVILDLRERGLRPKWERLLPTAENPTLPSVAKQRQD